MFQPARGVSPPSTDMHTTVYPSISAPLPVLMLLASPTGCSGPGFLSSCRHCFSFSGVLFFFFFSGRRDKSLILPFSLLPILITTTTSFIFAYYRQRMEGSPLGAFYQLWTASIYPPHSAFFPILSQYSPILLSAAFTVTFHHICGRRPSRVSLRFPTLIYDSLSSQL